MVGAILAGGAGRRIGGGKAVRTLAGRPLRVDTGDPAIDVALAGYRRIVVGYNREIVYPVI